jgi:GGDEF domain-containing protein
MISIQKEIRTAEDLQSLLVAVVETYRSSVEDSGQYAIDLDPSVTPAYREALRRIAERISVQAIGSASTVPSLRSAVRNVLRDYKEKAEQYLAELRGRLEEHASTLRTVLDALTSDSEDGERKLRSELKRFGDLTAAKDLAEMRAGVLSLKGSLETCIEELERRNRIVVAELTSEIQALQKQVDQLRAPASGASGMGVRERVEAETAAGNSFLLLFVHIRNLESIRARFGPELTERVIRCAIQRLTNLHAKSVTVGCWQEAVLCAVIREPDRAGVALARDANHRLSGKYVFTESDRVIEIAAQIVTASVERAADEPVERTAARVTDVLALLNK